MHTCVRIAMIYKQLTSLAAKYQLYILEKLTMLKTTHSKWRLKYLTQINLLVSVLVDPQFSFPLVIVQLSAQFLTLYHSPCGAITVPTIKVFMTFKHIIKERSVVYR